MEDGLDSPTSSPDENCYPVNGKTEAVMADGENKTNLEINGSSSDIPLKTETCSDSSDCDVLVIDESVKAKTKPNGKRTKKSKPVPFKNAKKNKTTPLVQAQKVIENSKVEVKNSNKKNVVRDSNKVRLKRGIKRVGKTQIREYAQYLGLQPSVQFKCVKCKCAGFESLLELNEHSMQCTETGPVQEASSIKTSTTQFKIARKVFLCSVCCTYYENWNLFLHMLEVHRRFICLYCLGMFSEAEKLSLHLVSKHNCVLGENHTIEEFFLKYKDPCYLLCCDCEKVFNVQDDFFDHMCVNYVDEMQSRKNDYLRHSEEKEREDPLEGRGNKFEKIEEIKESIDVFEEKNKSVEQKREKSNKFEGKDNRNEEDNKLEESALGKEKNRLEENHTFQEEESSFDKEEGECIKERSNFEDKESICDEKGGIKLGEEESMVEKGGSDELGEKHNKLGKKLRKKPFKFGKKKLSGKQIKLSKKENNSEEKQIIIKQKNNKSENKNEVDSHQVNSENLEYNEINQMTSKEHYNDSENSFSMENQETKELSLTNSNLHENDISLIKSVELEDTENIASNTFNGEDFPNEVTETSQYTNVNSNMQVDDETFTSVQAVDTRKVPKVTLKLSNLSSYSKDNSKIDNDESEDSEDLVMDEESVNETKENFEETNKNFEGTKEGFKDTEDFIDTKDFKNIKNLKDIREDKNLKEEKLGAVTLMQNIQSQVAGNDIPIIELELEHPLDKFEIRALIQKCLRATVPTCIYCNHARKIAVNGKQLGLHAIAEHRFSAIVDSITAEELIPESFNSRINDSLHELENIYFNLESTSPEEAVTFSHVFECFQCRYSTTVHKELYLHNRKMHAKTILLCIMCKSNFYSYSELISHLCPGLYALENDVRFRCCMCVSDELPSAFRLMVHLRKKHHACDVCLELCNNQSKLSNHVWKHKLHHFCYRCGIAYRNKPDITKHLFWKHGTESVLCKKCLQKKWPHVYHFCIPPPSFTCEECNLIFSRAVSLMVHKRLHSNEMPHACSYENCQEKFISKKLLLKHEFKHREPMEDTPVEEQKLEVKNKDEELVVSEEKEVVSEKQEEMEKPQLKVDIYDLPELNLSESDSSDSEGENVKTDVNKTNEKIEEANESIESILLDENKEESRTDSISGTEKFVPILENIWDDFKNYQANKEKAEGNNVEDKPDLIPILEDRPLDNTKLLEIIKMDHDYGCLETQQVNSDSKEIDTNMDHDYCSGSVKKENMNMDEPTTTSALSTAEKKNKNESSGSSSDSDSSSCTCGSNCSCSSSSGSSSSSSDSSGSDSSTSEGRRKKLNKKQQKKQAKEKMKPENEDKPDQPPVTFETVIQESDLETTETETDEDFYDEHPQKLASKLLAEKRSKLLLIASGVEHVNGSMIDNSRPSTPSLPEEYKPKKKSKSKKRKKKKSSKSNSEQPRHIPESVSKHPEPQIVAPLTLSLPKPILNHANCKIEEKITLNTEDSNLRASKRKRIPNKFYGYSSDEDRDKTSSPAAKWKKPNHTSLVPSNLIVPPLTIKTNQTPITPTVEPISIRTTSTAGEFKIQQNTRKLQPKPEEESGSDSNESSFEEEKPTMPIKEQPALYCYCRCPYDEVSEMIGCDSNDCAIEWFHFECVGIMVPPKGQWFCPDCRKRKQQQRKELLQSH